MKIELIKKQAAGRAKSLLSDYGIQDVPVNVHALAREVGARIVEEVLDDDTSGVLVIKNNQAVIGVNKYHHHRRQRFTIAHELGHFLLHRDDASVFVDTIFYRDANSSEGMDEQEIAANAFAAELLMPEPILRQYLKSQGIDLFDDVAVKRLALRFDVSEQALTIRLINLRLIAA